MISLNDFPPHSEAAILLRIALLGGFRAWVGSHLIPDEAWKRRNVQTLVKLLALNPRHCLHREQLMELLWPGAKIEAARNNLRQTLHLARQIFKGDHHSGCQILVDHNAWLSLSQEGEIWVDAQAFETAATAARGSQDPVAYQAALALYTGELLPEDRYQNWIVTKRESLQDLRLSLMSELGRILEGQGEIKQAVAIFNQIIATDPTAETAHRALMRLYAIVGNRPKALQQYQRLNEILRQELALEPDPKSRSLYEDILCGHFQT